LHRIPWEFHEFSRFREFPEYSRPLWPLHNWGEGQTDTQTHVTNIHFASSTTHAKCNRHPCWMAATQLCVSSSTKLPAVTQASLNRHSPNKRHLPVARWTEVGSRGQFLSSGWPTIRQPGFDLPRCYWALTNHFRTDQGHCACKGVLLIVIRCNEVTNFLIPSAGNYFVTVMRDVTITDDIWMRTRNF